MVLSRAIGGGPTPQGSLAWRISLTTDGQRSDDRSQRLSPSERPGPSQHLSGVCPVSSRLHFLLNNTEVMLTLSTALLDAGSRSLPPPLRGGRGDGPHTQMRVRLAVLFHC